MAERNKVFNFKFRSKSYNIGYGRFGPITEIDPVCGCISREKAAYVITLFQFFICLGFGIGIGMFWLYALIAFCSIALSNQKKEFYLFLDMGVLTIVALIYPWFAIIYFNLFRGIKEKDPQKICRWLKFILASTFLLLFIRLGVTLEFVLIFPFFLLEMYSLWIIYRYKTELERIKGEVEANAENDDVSEFNLEA